MALESLLHRNARRAHQPEKSVDDSNGGNQKPGKRTGFRHGRRTYARHPSMALPSTEKSHRHGKEISSALSAIPADAGLCAAGALASTKGVRGPRALDAPLQCFHAGRELFECVGNSSIASTQEEQSLISNGRCRRVLLSHGGSNLTSTHKNQRQQGQPNRHEQAFLGHQAIL